MAVVHAFQSIRYRMKWLIPTACLCGALEVAGWSGRLWSHFSVYLDSPFQLQYGSFSLSFPVRLGD